MGRSGVANQGRPHSLPTGWRGRICELVGPGGAGDQQEQQGTEGGWAEVSHSEEDSSVRSLGSVFLLPAASVSPKEMAPRIHGSSSPQDLCKAFLTADRLRHCRMTIALDAKFD